MLFSKQAIGGLLVALLVLAATLVVYYERASLFPGYGHWVRIGTVVVLVIVGPVATHWLARGLSPQREHPCRRRRLHRCPARSRGPAGAEWHLRGHRPAEHAAVPGR